MLIPEEVIMASKNEKTNTIFALAVGAIFGAGVALLFAPQSGKKTRRDVRRFGERALDKTQELRNEACTSIDNFAEEVWGKVQDDFDRGRKWTEQSISDIQKALDTGKRFIHDEIDKIRG
jgi:gas vesicle protein